MAYIGLIKPYVAKLDETATPPKYTDGFLCGKAIGMNISPQYAEGSLAGDDSQAEYDRMFNYAELTLNTTTLPVEAHDIMFGHTVNKEAQDGVSIVDKGDDEGSYVGQGFCLPEKVDGVKKYIAFWLYKCKYNEGDEAYTTKGDSIEYGTPSITGRALEIKGVGWRERKIFETEEAALAWLEEMAGMKTA